MNIPDLTADKLIPRWLGKRDYRIGMIGIGNIANHAHMPAYRKAGFNVVAAADISAQRREQAKSRWGIERVYQTYQEMLERERPEIVDINFPESISDEKVAAVQAASQAGAHILLQKPFAQSFGQCQAMVEAAQAGGVKLAVNQNARWAPAFYAAKVLLEEAWIGRPLVVNLEFRLPMRGAEWLLNFSVHSFDLVRWWLGREPDSVFCHVARNQAKQYFTSCILQFGDAAQASIWDDCATHLAECWRFRLVGDIGMIRGNEAWSGEMELAWVELCSQQAPGMTIRPKLSYPYVPEAFIGTMSDLMEAIEQDREPKASGADNLNTMRIVFAAFVSCEEHRALSPTEIR